MSFYSLQELCQEKGVKGDCAWSTSEDNRSERDTVERRSINIKPGESFRVEEGEEELRRSNKFRTRPDERMRGQLHDRCRISILSKFGRPSAWALWRVCRMRQETNPLNRLLSPLLAQGWEWGVWTRERHLSPNSITQVQGARLILGLQCV